jgi:Leucine-rich repeat (LRR) protein
MNERFIFIYLRFMSKGLLFTWIIFFGVFQIHAQSVSWEQALKMDPLLVKQLDCSAQKWESIPRELFGFTELTELDLSKNRLKALPQEFAALQKLNKLNLGRNKFENFPLVICQLQQLRVLHVDRNQITLLPEQIEALKALEILDLYANSIEYFGEGIFSLPNLKLLNIEGVMYGTIFAKQLSDRLPNTKILIDPPCKCLD